MPSAVSANSFGRMIGQAEVLGGGIASYELHTAGITNSSMWVFLTWHLPIQHDLPTRVASALHPERTAGIDLVHSSQDCFQASSKVSCSGCGSVITHAQLSPFYLLSTL